MASTRLLLDSGGLSALADGDPFALEVFERCLAHQAKVAAPAVVIAESTRGTSRDALVNKLLSRISVKGTRAVPVLDEQTARAAGRLLHATQSSATIDALIIAEADWENGTLVLTGDPEDLTRLAQVNERTSIAALGDSRGLERMA